MSKSNGKPKVLSLFTGCGGLDLGFHQSGYEILWANDVDSFACQTYRRNFDNPIEEGDIEKIDPYKSKLIPNCDLILGGFPCQDFSMIWKRPGLHGERGNLYKSFLS
jgi:DNA (cytosine-5)-methyltransferase 1